MRRTGNGLLPSNPCCVRSPFRKGDKAWCLCPQVLLRRLQTRAKSFRQSSVRQDLAMNQWASFRILDPLPEYLKILARIRSGVSRLPISNQHETRVSGRMARGLSKLPAEASRSPIPVIPFRFGGLPPRAHGVRRRLLGSSLNHSEGQASLRQPVPSNNDL